MYLDTDYRSECGSAYNAIKTIMCSVGIVLIELPHQPCQPNDNCWYAEE
jgi:hypothetical protein